VPEPGRLESIRHRRQLVAALLLRQLMAALPLRRQLVAVLLLRQLMAALPLELRPCPGVHAFCFDPRLGRHGLLGKTRPSHVGAPAHAQLPEQLPPQQGPAGQ
jgi:hypothetical protein